ncbi:hypothetical protein DY000_02019375 [Brassica cretica]|uniref:Uncharacterized protein n=1 Tax=Brassica cretica TaxID=69181 RepID=A0ABQ7DA82_BRACR|nr:hypothetical protein DY000_02019375 [Brassica cretica]
MKLRPNSDELQRDLRRTQRTRRSPTNSTDDLRRTRPTISDEFGYLQALCGVSFPCVKMFNESPNLSTLIDILLDLEAQQGGGDDSKSQVGMFVALAIVLRCKPEALTSVLPTLREEPKYQDSYK